MTSPHSPPAVVVLCAREHRDDLRPAPAPTATSGSATSTIAGHRLSTPHQEIRSDQ